MLSMLFIHNKTYSSYDYSCDYFLFFIIMMMMMMMMIIIIIIIIIIVYTGDWIKWTCDLFYLSMHLHWLLLQAYQPAPAGPEMLRAHVTRHESWSVPPPTGLSGLSGLSGSSVCPSCIHFIYLHMYS